MNPYKKYVESYADLLEKGKNLTLGGFEPECNVDIPGNAPVVLVFSPHPDDECITGALPLRLLRESRMRVVNVAVTLGSNKERQLARFDELQNACAYLGFDLVKTAERGLEKINLKTRAEDRAAWEQSVAVIKNILETHTPSLVMMPHESDANTTHTGTHVLVKEAMSAMGSGFSCVICETEFWAPLSVPNLMLESSVNEVADLVAGLSFHVGEVKRNPYHLLLPAWMMDNVRRGGELVGGQGGEVPDFTFATLYRMSKWENGGLKPLSADGRIVASGDNPLAGIQLFEESRTG